MLLAVPEAGNEVCVVPVCALVVAPGAAPLVPPAIDVVVEPPVLVVVVALVVAVVAPLVAPLVRPVVPVALTVLTAADGLLLSGLVQADRRRAAAMVVWRNLLFIFSTGN